MQIPTFDRLIEPLLSGDKTYLGHKCKSLLSPGENYGSVVVDIEVRLNNNSAISNKEEIIHCVAKTCPPRGFVWFLFNIPTTFKKEIRYYTEIVPKLTKFCLENKFVLNCYAKCYGARVSLDELSGEVDENACLLLENLKYNKYNTLDRFTGFDYSCTRAILRDLAAFHAVPIAYHMKHPNNFKTFTPILKIGLNSVFPEDVVEHLCTQYQGFMHDKDAHLLSRMKEGYRKILNFTKPQQNTNKLFHTISHNDMWVNNIMTKFENGSDIMNKFVDFQILDHSSLANDLIFFLYSSVQINVLRRYYDDFINFYYQVFIESLKKLQCNVEDYTLDAFLTEISYVARNYQFCHLVCMLVPIYTLKDKAKDLTQFSASDFEPKEENLHENFGRKLNFIIEDFSKRDWI